MGRTKSTAKLVMEYIDNIPIGDFVTRKELIKYVYDNITSKKDYETNYPYNTYSTIDNYRKILELNNIILPAPDNLPGHYMKIHEVPMDVSMYLLKDRAYTDPYYSSNSVSILDNKFLK